MISAPTGMGWVVLNEAPDNNYVAPNPLVGGLVLPMLAAAALSVGDAVWIAGNNQVNKSVVAGDNLKAIGIIVGGDLTAGEIQSEAAAVGRAAGSNVAVAGSVPSKVWVCVQGVTWVVADAAIAIGGLFKLSVLVAGRVGPAIAPVSLGKLLGPVAAAAAGDVRLALIAPA